MSGFWAICIFFSVQAPHCRLTYRLTRSITPLWFSLLYQEWYRWLSSRLYTLACLGTCLWLGQLAASVPLLVAPRSLSAVKARRHSHNPSQSLWPHPPASSSHQHISSHILRPSDIWICCLNAKTIGLRGLLPHLLNHSTTSRRLYIFPQWPSLLKT